MSKSASDTGKRTRKTSPRKSSARAAQAPVPRDTRRAAGSQAATGVSAEKRRAMIAKAAYFFRAAQRGFRDGDPVADWLAAETEVDARLMRQAQAPK